MRKRNKTTLLAGMAAGVLGLGLSGPALAFDTVNWNWEKDIREHLSIDGTVNIALNPTGWVELEKLQLFIGDVNATSTVSGVYNNQPLADGGSGTISFAVDWSGTADDSTDPSTFGTGVLGGGQATLSGDLSGSGDLAGTLDEGSDAMQLTATFNDIAVQIDPTGSYDALTELPEVVSAATAVGNNQNIDSQVALTLHDAQILFGGFDPNGRGLDVPQTGNTSFSLALAVLQNGATGEITPASISATSTVSDILNATVDSSATAVANNTNINLAAATPDDAMLVGDLTQVAYANVSAASSVSGVTLNNYTNLGMLDKPIVSSVATAVGNNLSITVTSPTGP